MHLEPNDKRFIGGCVLLFVCLSYMGWRVWGPLTSVVSFGFLLGVLLTGQVESYRRSQLQYRHVQSLFSIFSLLKINAPLPLMAGWAIPPDFAVTIVSLIFEHKPRRVLELGSGTSTLVTAYALKAVGSGTVTSLEQKEQFAAQSSQSVRKHDLQDVATVVHAPLKEVVVGNEVRFWYDTAPLEAMSAIDLVIVDGPTKQHAQRLPRYPALPVLFHRLSEEAIILVDDGRRADVKRMVELWRREFSEFEYELVDSEQGIIILRRRPQLSVATKFDREVAKS